MVSFYTPRGPLFDTPSGLRVAHKISTTSTRCTHPPKFVPIFAIIRIGGRKFDCVVWVFPGPTGKKIWPKCTPAHFPGKIPKFCGKERFFQLHKNRPIAIGTYYITWHACQSTSTHIGGMLACYWYLRLSVDDDDKTQACQSSRATEQHLQHEQRASAGELPEAQTDHPAATDTHTHTHTHTRIIIIIIWFV